MQLHPRPLAQHSFWNLPLRMDKMPSDLNESLFGDLVIYKGDANYRRLLEDRPYEIDRPFSECVGDLRSMVSTLALRCLKAELGCGMDKRKCEEVDDEEWMTNGKCGVVQFLEYEQVR